MCSGPQSNSDGGTKELARDCKEAENYHIKYVYKIEKAVKGKTRTATEIRGEGSLLSRFQRFRKSSFKFANRMHRQVYEWILLLLTNVSDFWTTCAS